MYHVNTINGEPRKSRVVYQILQIISLKETEINNCMQYVKFRWLVWSGAAR